EAGAVIMKNGKKEFQDIYKNHQNKTLSWSYWRLVNEQNDPELQRVHEKHYNSWNWFSKRSVNAMIKLKKWDWSGKFLNPKHRIRIGCAKMQEVKECR
ncbi:filamentous hemagglutinin, partial [Moraxella cuniculi DSM 21768]